MKKAIIIPNENKLIIPDGKYEISFEENINHCKPCHHFAKEYGLESYGDCVPSQVYGFAFAQQGILTILVERDNIVCYVPYYISDNQYQYFMKNQEILFRFRAKSFVAQNSDDETTFSLYDDSPEEMNPAKLLFKTIKERRREYKHELGVDHHASRIRD